MSFIQLIKRPFCFLTAQASLPALPPDTTPPDYIVATKDLVIKGDNASSIEAIKRIVKNFVDRGRGHAVTHLFIGALEERFGCRLFINSNNKDVDCGTITAIGFVDESQRNTFFIKTTDQRCIHVTT